MLYSSVVVAAFAALAHAAPVAEPIQTVTQVTDIYTTVFENAPVAAATTVATLTSTQVKWWKWPSAKTVKPVTTTTTPAAVVTPTSTPEPTTTSTTPVPTPETTTVATTPSTYVAPVESTTPATTSAAPAATVAASTGDSYSDIVIKHHNVHRANHSAGDIEWDDNLASIANTIANSCNYAHDTKTGGGGYGQNIAAGCPASNISSVITELFYNGEVNNFNGLYDQATPSNINDDTAFDGYGHFTQIVWKATTKVGCATVNCAGKGNGPQGLGNVGADVPPIFTVCNYESAGNYLNEFKGNVGRPLGHPTVHWDTPL